MSAHELGLRQAMVAAARELDARGLNRGSSGNLSVRLPARVSQSSHSSASANTNLSAGWLITPTGVPALALQPEAMVHLNAQGQAQGPGRPSSEWRFHRDILASRTEVGAVVHTHSPFATSLACLHRDVPAFHYMVAVAGGDSIRCAPYALFGTQALSDHALAALAGRNACLLANHGMIALGADLSAAVALALEVESLCEQYWRALQLGPPVLLSAEQMAAVLEKFKTYGRAAQEGQAT